MAAAVGTTRIAAFVVVLLAVAACGGESALPATQPPQLTTSFVPEAQLGSPAPKETTTTTTSSTTTSSTTIPPRPAGFPGHFPVPEGQVGFYTGSPELGFHLNVATSLSFSELVQFFTQSLQESEAWAISVRDIGQGFVPGFEEVWATYTAPDHAVTQLSGDYNGVIEIEGRHVDILLDGLVQPAPGEDPGLLPPPDDLPRPDAAPLEARYSSGIIKVAYAGGAELFTDLLTRYRNLQWTELGLSHNPLDGGIAVGELGKWRITLRDEVDTVEIDFEDRSLVFP